jgi:hypothetical protein
MKTKFFLVLAFVLLVSISIFADMKGRDVVDKGEVSEVSGVLTNDGSEWYLDASNKKMLIHLGPEFYRDEIGLKLEEGKYIDITGYVYEDEVTPVSVNYDGKEFTFRDEVGRPAWAGRGNRDGNYRDNNRKNEGRGNQRNFKNQK